MQNWFRKLIGLAHMDDISNMDVESFKAEILKQHEKKLNEIVKINKRFRVIISKGELEMTIQEIGEIAQGK